jgi:malonyl-CoA/methylmalonyl-CoA synthetase
MASTVEESRLRRGTNVGPLVGIGNAGAVANLFSALFAGDPNRACLETPTRSLSYGGLADLARRLGQAVLDQGVAPGERLVAQTVKSVDGYALWLGCLAAGVVYVPTNTAYTPDEIGYFCTDAGASLLVVDDPGAVASVDCATVSLAALVEAADDASPVAVGDDEPCSLVYTSGTTGRPKGATLTHGCILDNGRALADVWQFSEDDVLVHSLPIFHVHGLFIALHPTLLSGASVRFLPKFDVDTVLAAMPGATVLMGVPTYYHRLLGDDRFGPESCSSMRLFTSGSAPMTEITHAEFTERTGRRIVERYGMSEAGIITSNRMDDVLAGSVGHPLPGYEVRVVDDEHHPVAAGETGTVEVRGPSLCLGYWGRPDADAESRTDDGWFSTGDVGFADATGRITLEGRSSDMIISGGLNIYPKEIEMVLDELDGVVESAVVGLPDPDFGEAVTAYLVLEDGKTIEALPLAEALAPLARFKHPKSFHQLPELPRNAMGKVQKVVLRSN